MEDAASFIKSLSKKTIFLHSSFGLKKNDPRGACLPVQPPALLLGSGCPVPDEVHARTAEVLHQFEPDLEEGLVAE
jgi:hypothetical protein